MKSSHHNSVGRKGWTIAVQVPPTPRNRNLFGRCFHYWHSSPFVNLVEFTSGNGVIYCVWGRVRVNPAPVIRGRVHTRKNALPSGYKKARWAALWRKRGSLQRLTWRLLFLTKNKNFKKENNFKLVYSI